MTAVMTEHNANPSVLIDWFDYFSEKYADGTEEPTNEFRFLSNFFVGEPLTILGYEWQTGEHFFAAMKAGNKLDFDRIRNAKTPSAAKALGRKIKLRFDWSEIKYDVMRLVLAAKFTEGRAEKDMLLATGTAMLVEGTWWGDTVWGLDRRTGKGANWLGLLLMARRAELVSGVEFDYSHTEKRVLPYWWKN